MVYQLVFICVKNNETKDIDDWLNYNFKGFPIIATITELTQIQSNINLIKRDFLFEMIKE
jgi:hypothetical protein